MKKLEKVNELVIQIKRVVDVLERIAGIRSKTLEDDLISWPVSRGEETETVERINKEKEKGKQKKERIDGLEKKEEVRGQEEENTIEGVEKKSSSFSPVAFSVGTGFL